MKFYFFLPAYCLSQSPITTVFLNILSPFLGRNLILPHIIYRNLFKIASAVLVEPAVTYMKYCKIFLMNQQQAHGSPSMLFHVFIQFINLLIRFLYFSFQFWHKIWKSHSWQKTAYILPPYAEKIHKSTAGQASQIMSSHTVGYQKQSRFFCIFFQNCILIFLSARPLFR